MVTFTTVGCGSPVLKALASAGGGPNVAANTQIGKTNTQTLGSTSLQEIKAEQVTQVTNIEVDYWLIALLVVGSVLFGTMVDDVVKGWFKRGRQ